MDVNASAVVLVASPEFKDPLWRRTVLLAAPLPNGGHVGVIINRPTVLTLGKLFPDHAPSQKVRDPVYFGGPFFANVLVAVVRYEGAIKASYFPLATNMALATGERAIDDIIERDASSARYYAGLIVWRPGELTVELEKKLWSVCNARAETVFRTDVKELWKELSATLRRRYVGTPLPKVALAQGLQP